MVPQGSISVLFGVAIRPRLVAGNGNVKSQSLSTRSEIFTEVLERELAGGHADPAAAPADPAMGTERGRGEAE